MKAFKDWAIVKAIVAIWKWCYAEVGTALSLLKYPVAAPGRVILKYSVKRIFAVGLGVDALVSGTPHDLWTLLVFAAKLVTAVVILWVAAATKT